MNRMPVIIGLILWMILFCISLAFEDDFSKRLPRYNLRAPRFLAVLGIGVLFMCVWLIYEILHAGDWSEAKLFYLLIGIPFFALLVIGGTWMFLFSINWGMDIKEDRIVYRNIFRRTRTVYFTEVTGIQRFTPRFSPKKNRRRGTMSDYERIFGRRKSFGSYRIYIGRRSIKVDSAAYNYEGSVERILNSMKKQGIQCPVTTQKTWSA